MTTSATNREKRWPKVGWSSGGCAYTRVRYLNSFLLFILYIYTYTGRYTHTHSLCTKPINHPDCRPPRPWYTDPINNIRFLSRHGALASTITSPCDIGITERPKNILNNVIGEGKRAFRIFVQRRELTTYPIFHTRYPQVNSYH